jgi:hypothetical protein
MKFRFSLSAWVTVSVMALAATGCGLDETKEHYDQLPPDPSPQKPLNCPDVGNGFANKDMKPQTAALNLARTRVRDEALIYVSDADWLRVYNARNQSFVGKIKQESANAGLILADDKLFVLNQNLISVFKTNGAAMPEKLSSTPLSGEFMSARVIADRVVVVSAKNALTTQKLAYSNMQPNSCDYRQTFFIEEKFYETQITSLAIDDLEDSMSVKLMGFVSAKFQDSVLSFVEVLENQQQGSGRIIRIMDVLPDGRLGELQIIDKDDPKLKAPQAIMVVPV